MTGQPTRLSIPTCTGCESIKQWGTCAAGCREQRFDVVRADLVDWMDKLADRSHGRAARLRAAAGQFAGAADGGKVPPWEQMRRAAATALSSCPDADATDRVWTDTPVTVTLWRCDACGGVDAPQECLGICTWRMVEWASVGSYEKARARADSERETEARVRALLRKVAHVRPRPGREAETRRALTSEARALLGQPPARPAVGMEPERARA